MSKKNHRESSLSALFQEQDSKPQRREEQHEKFRRDKAVPRRTRIVPYQFDQKAQSVPNVGDKVAIRHTSENTIVTDKLGTMLQTSGKLKRSAVEVRTVKRVYLGDSNGYSIQDNAGEQWTVRPSACGSARWETFIRGEGRKEVVGHGQ